MDKKRVKDLLNRIGELCAKVKPQPTFVTIPKDGDEAITKTLKDSVNPIILEIWDEVKKG